MCAATLVVPAIAAAAPQAGTSSRAARQAWLKSTHRKLKKDSEQLLELARELRKHALKHEQNPLALAVREPIQALEKRAEALRAAVAAVDENFLSLPVVTQAEEIREEAKALQGIFSASPSPRELKKLRQLARQIEKRAASIADRMRLP